MVIISCGSVIARNVEKAFLLSSFETVSYMYLSQASLVLCVAVAALRLLLLPLFPTC